MKNKHLLVSLLFTFLLGLLSACGEAKKIEEVKVLMSEEQYDSALLILNEISGYEGVSALIEECNVQIELEQKYADALATLDNSQYLEAAALFEEISDYKDSSDMVKNCKYQYASKMLDYKDLTQNHNRDVAFSILEELGDYKGSDKLLLEKQYQYANDLCNKYKRITPEAATFFKNHLDYEDCLSLYSEYITESVDNIVKEKSSGNVKGRSIKAFLQEIPEGYDFLYETYAKAVMNGVDYCLEREEYQKAKYLGEALLELDYPGAKEKGEEAVTAYQSMLDANAKKREEQKNNSNAAKAASSNGSSASGSTSNLTMNDIGVTYTDSKGLSVTLNSYSKNETSGYTEYSINYTLTNNVPDSKIMEGTFKLFFTDNTGEPQYGGFDYLFFGDSINRSYTWKVLNSQQVLTLEYNADDSDTGLNGAFFRNKPKASSFHWSTP